MDDIDTLESGREVLKLDKQVIDSKVTDSKIKLAPVIMRKTFGQRNSASSHNTVKNLPAQLITKLRSISITSEKTTSPLKKVKLNLFN